MPPKIQHSTATGQPDHAQPTVPGVVSGIAPSYPPLPARPHDQRPPHYGGVTLPIDPILEAAGAFWNDNRELVRKWRIHAGAPDEIRNAAGVVVRRIQRYWTRERHVAPPGMTLETAREMGLDFYSPQLGWIRSGIKRETDSIENLGTGHLVGEIDTEEIEVAPNGAPLPAAAAVAE
jgi:hypothetical protein